MNTTPQPQPVNSPVSPPKTFTATLEFKTRDGAEKFAIAWSRATLRGHTLTKNLSVVLHDVTMTEKAWIDTYVETAAKA